MKYTRFLTLAVVFVALSTTILAQNEDYVRVYTEQQDDFSIDFYADNQLFIPAFVYIEFESLINLTPDAEMPFGAELEPETQAQYLFSLNPGDGNRISYNFGYSYSMGNPQEVDPDEDYLYRFPFEHGTKQQVTQGFNGRFTHMDENQFAVDFDLEVGTPIHAARSGIVVEIKEDSNIGGAGVEYGPYANYILVMHDDGTFGNYVHLRKNGVLVKPGDLVTTGQLIGYSGNTGRSSGPHLHFDVRIPRTDGTMQSIPILFTNDGTTSVFPEEDQIFYAYQPGGAPFEAIFGRDIENSDYTNYSETTDAIETLDFRVEQVDFTYVIFIGNGFDYALDADVTLRLRSMNSTTGSPVEVRLEPGEERFLTILRPEEGAENWSYGYSVSYRRLQ